MGKIHVGALTVFTYPERRKCFLQLIYHGERFFQLKLMDIKNNSENFLVNSWYLNINPYIGLIFILEY
jgi:hypothetical protein